MGKKKVKRKSVTRKKPKLDSQFNCLFCNNEKSIDCKLDRKNSKGYLSCRVCGVAWECEISYLSEAVDIYSDWVDSVE
jgi:transcription elongation factor Elf1